VNNQSAAEGRGRVKQMTSSLPQRISSATAHDGNVGVGGSPIGRLVGLGRETEGQDLSEYALLASLIAVVAIVALVLVGSRIAAMFNSVAGAL